MPRLLMFARAALACALVLLYTPAFATQVLALSTAEMGSESDAVVRARVAAVRSYWNPAHTRILTEVELQVEESYKGAAANTIRVVQVGGVVDGVRMTAHGLPSWDSNEDVLLFLEDSLPGRYRIAGFSQGKFSVQVDAQSGDIFVNRAPLGVARITASGERSSGEASIRMPLTDLLREALPDSPRFQEGR